MKRYYRVRAYDTINGNSGATNEAFAVTNLPGPGELTVTSASSTALNLNFSDNTDGETSYELWQSTNAGAYVHVHTLDPNAEQGPMVYQRTGLNPGTTYSFRVRAKNDAQASIFTLHETATTAGAQHYYLFSICTLFHPGKVIGVLHHGATFGIRCFARQITPCHWMLCLNSHQR